MTSEDDRSIQAQKGDASSVKSDAFEVFEDDDDLGISFTAATTASVHEGKYCLDKIKQLCIMHVRSCTSCRQQEHAGSKTLFQQNCLVLNWGCQLNWG